MMFAIMNDNFATHHKIYNRKSLTRTIVADGKNET